MPKASFVALFLPRNFMLVSALTAMVAAGGLLFSPTAKVEPYMAATGPLPPLPVAEIGQKAPDFTLMDLDGAAVSLSSLQGRPVILYFWATWCPYCIQDLPALVELQDRYEEQGLRVLAIDILENQNRVEQEARKLGLQFPVLLDADAHVSRTYAVRATPTYFFIDREGVLRDVLIGSPRPGAVAGRLRPLLTQG